LLKVGRTYLKLKDLFSYVIFFVHKDIKMEKIQEKFQMKFAWIVSLFLSVDYELASWAAISET